MKDAKKATLSSRGDGILPQDRLYGWLSPSAFGIPGWNFSERIAHLPFYFWLIDTVRPRVLVDLVPRRPDDYLAFCQASEQLNCAAQCFGVSDIFDDRDLDDAASLEAYHNVHFGSNSHLHDEPTQIFETLGRKKIDLLYIDGREASKLPEVEFQRWLAQLSSQGLIIVVHPGHLAASCREIIKRRPSFALSGKPNLELIAATSTYPPELSAAFAEPGNIITATMQSAFAHFASGLRERAAHRDSELFASKVEISLAQQSAATDLLRSEKIELEEKYLAQTQDTVGHKARIAILEEYVEQFRAEILRLQEYAIKSRNETESVQDVAREGEREIEKLRLAIADRDAEILRLQEYAIKSEIEVQRANDSAHDRERAIERLRLAIGDRDAEIRRLKIFSEKLRSENIKRINVLDDEIQANHGEILRLTTLASVAESEIVRLKQLISDSGAEVVRLKGIIAARDEEVRSAKKREILQGEKGNSRETELTAEIFKSESRANSLQSRVTDLENTLNVITQSTSWQITRPVRRLFAGFPKTARVLRRAIKLLWWTLTLQLFSRLKQIRFSEQQLSQSAVTADALLDLPSVPASLNAGSNPEDDGAQDKSGSTLDERETDEAPSSSSSTGDIAPILLQIKDFERTVSELASNVSLLSAPAEHPQIVDRAEFVRIENNIERETGRIQVVENRIVQLMSIVDLERYRVDYALLGVDGMLNEIETYHQARAKNDYKKVFEQVNPLVSICVSTMNRSDLLIERCLASLVNQSYRNIQIIVVGDHCTDDTGSRVAHLRDSRVCFHNLSSRGPYPAPGIDRWMVAGTNAINAAMTMCEGQFVTHLDDDDAATNDRIETMVNAAQQHKADFCWHPIWYEKKDGSWYKLGDGRFELAQITTGSTFYHHYFTKFPWDVFAYRTREPGDWNRLRKIRALRPHLHFVDRPLMFHYSEGSQSPFTARHGEMFVE